MPPNWFEKWIKVHGVDVKATPVLPPDVTDFTAVSFEHPALWQSDDFFEESDRTRITIPKRLAGRYYLRATIRWERADFNEFQIADRDESCFLSYVTKNGDSMADHLEDSHMTAAPIVKAVKAVTNTLWEGNLVKDDFIKLFVKHNGTIIDDHDKPLSIMINVWLTLRRLGPRTL